MKLSVRWIRGKEDYAEIFAHEIPSGLLDANERTDIAEHLREIAQELHPVESLESELAHLRAEVEGMRVPTEEMVSVCLQRFRKEIDIHMDTKHPSASPGHDAMRIALRAAFAARKEADRG